MEDRLVESLRIRKALETIYVGILPKSAAPFIYLRCAHCSAVFSSFVLTFASLQLDPRSVDVNIHPTKREVHFLNEETIVQRVSDAMYDTLVGENESRTFEYQVCTSLVG